jgi:hypothetical protein
MRNVAMWEHARSATNRGRISWGRSISVV